MSEHEEGRPAPSRPSRLWWVYFAYLVGSGILGMGSYFATVREAGPSRQNLIVSTVATALNLIGMVGLFAYIRSQRIAWSGFWQAVLGLTVIQVVFAASMFARSLSFGAGGREGVVALLGLGGLLLGLPLVFALWRYAFLSPRIWQS